MRLGIQVAGFNCNGKILFFIKDGIEVEVLMNSDQQVTLKLNFLDSGRVLITTLVYAKCDAVDRLGSPFTWWNRRAGEDCIFKRLDRILVNNQLQEWFGNLQMEHLSRTGSDHAPLLLTAGEQVQQFSKPFRFLKFWIDHESFLYTVEQHWSTDFVGDAFITLKLKMKKLKTTLSVWSKETFDDIFKQLTIREDIVKIKEMLFEEDTSEINRMVLQHAQAEFKRYMHFEEEF
ncbi:uncharacterized protein LOC132612146 [Lycium barbarum]|uniref:uncharacterized protein LOC132612146 n=1 Tax=Lycium barbarum TaxID=112863 RepID=UPI00293EAD7C|nr:uncharacterized protein LOC132612146 [Lycium barbarum]